MRAERMTVSAVGIGSGADMNLLSNIANWGGGRNTSRRILITFHRFLLKRPLPLPNPLSLMNRLSRRLLNLHRSCRGLTLSWHHFCSLCSTQPKPTAEIFWFQIAAIRCLEAGSTAWVKSSLLLRMQRHDGRQIGWNGRDSESFGRSWYATPCVNRQPVTFRLESNRRKGPRISPLTP